MPVIYMKHPVHGSKVAISHLEVEEDEKNGWEVYNPDTLLTPIEAAQTEEAKKPTLEEVEIDVLRELYTEKFGKAPHHKKTAETLRKELGNGDSR